MKNLQNNQEDHRIGFRGEIYDYLLIIIASLFVVGFFLLKTI